MKTLRINFYKHEVKLLNLVAVLVLIANGIDLMDNGVNFYRLLWSGVCIAATIFIDSCQQNVFKLLSQRKVATIIIAIVITIGILTLCGLIF